MTNIGWSFTIIFAGIFIAAIWIALRSKTFISLSDDETDDAGFPYPAYLEKEFDAPSHDNHHS